MGLFTLHKFSLDNLKSYLESKSRLVIPQFSDYHCSRYNNENKKNN